jgi:hypothetical protein
MQPNTNGVQMKFYTCDDGHHGPQSIWAIIGPGGMCHIGHHRDEDHAWTVAFGWPNKEDVDWMKNNGWRAIRVFATQIEDESCDGGAE